MIIIGAGMSGMLAGQHFRHMNPLIYEKQPSLPNNHKALLRFRSDAVSQLTGIPFKKVRVSKMINYKEQHLTESNMHLNNMYSQKVSGAIRERSMGKLETCDRFIAPEDFIEQLSNGLNIEYNTDVSNLDFNTGEIIISTMPVTALADLIGYSLDTELKTKEIWTMRFNISDFVDCDIYQTVYYPNPQLPLYRLSITGSSVIAEFCEDPVKWGGIHDISYNICHFLYIDFGIKISSLSLSPQLHKTKHGKLIPCDGNEVKKFMQYATQEHNIYSLGRWGTHRQILMDDVVNDLKVIHKMILSDNYSR